VRAAFTAALLKPQFQFLFDEDSAVRFSMERTLEAEEDDDECCAICCESSSFETLPCSCRMKFCPTCWDRSLAASIATRGCAQCPSCRSVVKVDFDSDTGRLVFERAKKTAMTCDWSKQLYVKARPTQIRRLQEYGAAIAADAAKHVEPHSSLLETVGASSPVDRNCTSTDSTTLDLRLQCACGSPIERLSTRMRLSRMLDHSNPAWRQRTRDPVEKVIDRLVKTVKVTCDLCGEDALRTGAVWNCVNGNRSVLHTSEFDVCESCFRKHVDPKAPAIIAIAATAQAAPKEPLRGGFAAGARGSQPQEDNEGLDREPPSSVGCNLLSFLWR
jgi:hypothetical protein